MCKNTPNTTLMRLPHQLTHLYLSDILLLCVCATVSVCDKSNKVQGLTVITYT